MDIFLVIIGLILLVIGGEFLVRSSVALSFKFNISKMIIGLTVVSFATSSPELLVSLQAALSGYSDISLGNVIGSNIANIGLVLGLTAIISSMDTDSDFIKFNWPVMMILTGMMYLFLYTGKNISRLEGGALLLVIVVFLGVLIKKATTKGAKSESEVDPSLEQTSGFKIILWLLIGAAGLYFGSEWLVDGAVGIAQSYEVSERVISVTMIAIGTSVPELAASVIAALKQEKGLSLGNLIGSNIFNIGSVIGLTAIIQPIFLQSEEVLTNDIFWMIGFSLILAPLIFIPPKKVISRYKGVILFLAYILFILLAFRS
ncbi:calcium:sodium antiporter [Psychroflexus torquis ATCC 700755]|uniref:Calcium:sodium antiporter n=1 Tax=Psychroflexus torquis (strain ATCC 700755 / CIP 106069 / ACAM 623) TaxID=313595 RepID=K4IGG7_PSYTT|nr:calcium/sodium antiporter [Psychroflexus torquis]AFU69597.1 calcium:sodium antiporter [Psychroflexus torquis ATCC 700755]